jgi:hypothetical protein
MEVGKKYKYTGETDKYRWSTHHDSGIGWQHDYFIKYGVVMIYRGQIEYDNYHIFSVENHGEYETLYLSPTTFENIKNSCVKVTSGGSRKKNRKTFRKKRSNRKTNKRRR